MAWLAFTLGLIIGTALGIVTLGLLVGGREYYKERSSIQHTSKEGKNEQP